MFADWGDSMNIYSNIKHKLLIRKLKKLCFHPSYFAGCEIYRLLNYNTLPQINYYLEESQSLQKNNLFIF